MMQKSNEKIKLTSEEIEESAGEPNTSTLEELISDLLVDYWMKERNKQRKDFNGRSSVEDSPCKRNKAD